MAAESRAGSVWASRFMLGAIIQGGIALILVVVLLYLAVYGTPTASRIVASGSAGTWLTVGFVGFILVGVVGTAVSALFYQHIEVGLGRPYTGSKNLFAWLHLVLMNVGALVGGGLMMLAGYVGGAALLPRFAGGQEMTSAEVHEMILAAYPLPIAIFMAIGALGVFLGGLGYVASWFSVPEGD